MELLPVRSFFAEALASLYVVSGEKAADQRARDVEDAMPAARSDAGRSGDDVGGEADGPAGLGGVGVGAAAGAAGESAAAESRPRRVRRFRS